MTTLAWMVRIASHPASTASSGPCKVVDIFCHRADGWMTKNRSGRQPIAGNPLLFPSGMKALADYVHALGALVTHMWPLV